MQSELIKQLIAVIVVIFVLTFGFKAIAMVQDRLCDTRLSTADIDIKSGVRTSQFGSFDKKAIPIGCIDKAIFVDLGRADKSLLDSYPAVKNSVEGSKANVFLLKGDRIVKSFEAGNIEAGYPYFLCVKPRAGKLNLFMEGKGNRTRITADCIDDCTAAVVTAKDVEKIKTDAASIGETVTEASDKIEVKRKFCRFKENFTKVEITINAKDKLDNVKYIEYMPKECIDDLNAYLESVLPDYYKIKADPLIMWHFNEMNKGKEETITYILKIELSDYCKELISGMGILSAPNYGPYLSKELPYTTLFLGDPPLSINLDEYFKDPDNSVLTYNALGNSYVSAYTSNNEATVSGSNPVTETEVSFTASDSANSVPAGMTVRVLDSGACLDNDLDGYGRNCPSGEDCNDNDNSINSGKTDSPCDGIDQNCDGADAQNTYDCYNADNDGDAYRADSISGIATGCSRPSDCKERQSIADCNDNNANIHPNQAENCNNDIDDNCDNLNNDGCDCTGTVSHECGATPCTGIQTCSNGQWPACTLLVSSCGTRDCSSNNYYSLSGNVCNYYGYPNCYDSCTAPGTCTSCICSSPTIASSQTLNPSQCQYIAGCTGTTLGSIANYPATTPCTGGTCDGNGGCVTQQTCTPQSCSSLGYNCGSWSDGCSGTANLNCGSCGTGQTCSGGSCANAVAELSLGFSNINYQFNNPYHYYYHTRTFMETKGVGVTLTQGQLCFQSGGCNSATVNYRINANGAYTWSDNFYTSYSSEKFTLKYWGTDDHMNLVYVEQSMDVVGSWHNP